MLCFVVTSSNPAIFNEKQKGRGAVSDGRGSLREVGTGKSRMRENRVSIYCIRKEYIWEKKE